MALDSNVVASNLFNVWNTTFTSSTSLVNIAKIIDDGFQMATVSAPNFTIVVAAGSLVFPTTIVNGVEIVTPLDIATACSNYWALTILTDGTPQSCDNIDSVVNDANKIIEPITSGLIALASSKTLSLPPYLDFVNIIFDNVKTIIWTIEESDSTCNSTLTGTVS